MRNTLAYAALCALGALLALPLASAEEARTLVVAADEWCPINCNPRSPQQGIGIDLTRRVFEPLGYRVRYVIMPWSRALSEVKAGRVDAVVGANSSDDADLVYPRTPVYAISDDFYVRSDNPLKFKGVESLKGRRLGIIKDYGYDAKIKELIEDQKKNPGMVQEVAGDDALRQNIMKLEAGRIDVAIESRAVMDYRLDQLGLSDKIRWVGGIPQGSVYVAFSPARPESKDLARKFDEGVKKLERQDKLHALYETYSLSPP